MKSTLKIAILLCLLYLSYQASFQCNVANCQYCSYPNFCGQCQSNYLLTWSNSSNTYSCAQVVCASNCMTCYSNNTCQVCNSGYYLTINSTCSLQSSSSSNLPINCIWGTGQQNCTVCAYGYSLQAGFCYPIFQMNPNDIPCLIQQAPMICQICAGGYFVGPLGTCVTSTYVNQTNCNIANCAYCSNANSTCSYCMPGFQLTSQNTCTNTTCNQPGCAKCGPNGQCSNCLIGYNYNSMASNCTLVGYGCSDPNCRICDGPQSCGQCVPGYIVKTWTISGGKTVNICRPLACPFNIQNCISCNYQYNTMFNYGKILCWKCNPGYNLVNGYCTAQLQIYSGSVSNCNNSYSFNNFCSQCNTGFVLSPLGICINTQCTNIPNCAACGANFVCQQCASGYTLSLGFLSINTLTYVSVSSLLTAQCIPSSIACNITNCDHCFSNNTCAACTSGYDFLTQGSNTCSPTCSVNNCYQCSQGSGSNVCLVCNIGYTLSSNGLSCSQITFSCAGCASNNTCYYNWTTQQPACTQCSSGMILYNGACYSTSCNIFGCAICQTWSNPPKCLQCNQGLILGPGYCIQLNCNNNVPNCKYCIQNNTCLACQNNFLLTNTSGTPACVAKSATCNDPNCLQCVSGSPNNCTKCALPYNVSNMVCVCGFQNCLSCKTSAISCDSCPYPLFSSILTQGCVPSPSLKHTCNVADCEFCLTDSQCSVCSIGYSLVASNLTCSLNNCSMLGLSNCQLCDPIGYVCHQCMMGYTLSNIIQGGQCIAINAGYTCNVAGCAVCNNSNGNQCLICLPAYTASGSSQCIANNCSIPNCYMCLQNNICTQCITGYYLTVNTNNQESCLPTMSNLANCQGNISNCAMCVVNLYTTNNQSYCIQCNDGFQFDSTNSVCIPATNSIPHCKIQANYGYYIPPFCLVCEQGYFINSYGLCSQYNPATNNTNCTVANCLYCGVNSTQCSFCFSPWGITSSGLCQGTIACSANCQFCTNSSVCLTCASSYTLNQPNTCVLCQVPNCQLCQQQNVCKTCASPYVLSNSNICLSCNITNCLSCSDDNICSSCANSPQGNAQYPSPTGNACFICDKTLPNMANCSSCNNSNSCGLCQNGYQVYIPSGGNGICIQCNIQNCQKCALSGSTVTCQTCVLGYSPNGASCTQCLYPCATCSTNPGPNNCQTCQPPLYFSTALSNGSCVLNTIPNCNNYNSGNLALCISCNSNYQYYSQTNTCNFTCAVNCQSCGSNGCNNCVPGYYLANNGSCAQCQIIGCQSCTNGGTVCSQCFTGFYILSNQCKQCPGYCSACTGGSLCTSLAPSTQSQVLITINNATVLAVCQSNCITCSNLNPQVCLQCQSGFYLSGGNCFKCSSNCLTCNSTIPDQCFSCYTNNFLSGLSCISCSSNCLTCQSSNNPNACVSCPDGSYLGSNSTCIQGCSINCISCTSPTNCIKCMSGYTTFNQNGQQLCAPCTTSCRTCADGQPASCMSCGVGFYLSGTNCISCTTNCNTCTAIGCISCIEGFFLTSTQTCSVNCVLPCSTCSGITPTKCTGCIAGYSYNDISNTCNQILTCNGPCLVCPLGYSLNQGKCVQCTANQCQTCNPNSPSQCYSCLAGFFLNSNNQCQTCPSSCATCLSNGGCITCASGFTKVPGRPISSNGFTCIPCNSPCATCANTPDYCTSCVSGFQFMGWKCAQSFYFAFQVTLLVDFPIFNKNYYSFILALTNAISAATPNAITILSIAPGSVVVQGGAGPTGGSGTQQANQQFSSLDAALSPNSNIAGMPVGQSSVTVVGGSVDYKSVNLALILGICIPVGVLIIVGIIVYCYCKKKKSAQVIQQKIKQDNGFTVRQSFQLSSHYKEQDTQRPFQNTTTIN